MAEESIKPCVLFIHLLVENNVTSWEIYRPTNGVVRATAPDQITYSDSTLISNIKQDELIKTAHISGNKNEIRFIGFYWNMGVFILNLNVNADDMNAHIGEIVDPLLKMNFNDKGQLEEDPKNYKSRYFWVYFEIDNIPINGIQEAGSSMEDLLNPTNEEVLENLKNLPVPHFIGGAAGGVNMSP